MASRFFRRGMWVAALVVLFLLNLYWVRREPPLVRIGEIGPAMNFSRVRVQGMLKSDARVLRGGAVLYSVADKTGSLPVFLSRAPSGDLPKAGCRIAATGHLSVGTGNRKRMRVKDAGQIELLGVAGPVVVSGRVVGLRAPPPDSNAPYRIVLDTSGGPVEVVHWFGSPPQVAVGDSLETEGIRGFYKGREQIKVRNPADIRLLPE